MPRNNPERHRKVKESMVKSWKAGDNRAQRGATRNEQGQPGPMWENVGNVENVEMLENVENAENVENVGKRGETWENVENME